MMNGALPSTPLVTEKDQKRQLPSSSLQDQRSAISFPLSWKPTTATPPSSSSQLTVQQNYALAAQIKQQHKQIFLPLLCAFKKISLPPFQKPTFAPLQRKPFSTQRKTHPALST